MKKIIFFVLFILLVGESFAQKKFPKGKFSNPVVHKIKLIDDGRLYAREGVTMFSNDPLLHRGRLSPSIVDSIRQYVQISAKELTGAENVVMMPSGGGLSFGYYALPNYSFRLAKQAQSGDVYLKYVIRLRAHQFKFVTFVSYMPRLHIRVVAKTPVKRLVFRKSYVFSARSVGGFQIPLGDFTFEKTNGLKPEEVLKLFKTSILQVK
ncbi:MAG: hypothetical protein N2Z72_03225 [Bacteroidales bacterium]|nr:hypothetical protein [Bacteroidales bacterium]